MNVISSLEYVKMEDSVLTLLEVTVVSVHQDGLEQTVPWVS